MKYLKQNPYHFIPDGALLTLGVCSESDVGSCYHGTALEIPVGNAEASPWKKTNRSWYFVSFLMAIIYKKSYIKNGSLGL